MLESVQSFFSQHLFAWETIALSIFFILFIVYVRKKIFLRPKKRVSAIKEQTPSSPTIITSQDIKAIAGEDVLATQLDLARAYIELNKKKIAKQILSHVIQHGNENLKDAAQKLWVSL